MTGIGLATTLCRDRGNSLLRQESFVPEDLLPIQSHGAPIQCEKREQLWLAITPGTALDAMPPDYGLRRRIVPAGGRFKPDCGADDNGAGT